MSRARCSWSSLLTTSRRRTAPRRRGWFRLFFVAAGLGTLAKGPVGPAIIGVTCRDSLEHARAAAQAGADYVSFGAMFASPTKPTATIAPADLLGQSAAFGVARVAIGGISPDNATSLIEAGADYVASISSLFRASDVRREAQRFAQLFPQSSHSRN